MADVTEDTEHPKAKKRRIPKSCSACRDSKLGCDKERPCTRCANAGIECIYFERPKDPNVERIERIENELASLRERLDVSPSSQCQSSPATTHSVQSLESRVIEYRSNMVRNSPGETLSDLADYSIRPPSSFDVVASGAVHENDAQTWFSMFFEGCNRFVPVFDVNDTYASVRNRSSILFDIIIIYGARAANGVTKTYQSLYSLLRQHTSDLVLRLSETASSHVSIEDIQAILVIASYSESGALLCDIAIRAAMRVGLPRQLESLLDTIAERKVLEEQHEQVLFTAARVWSYLFVLDMILSLDGGKPPSIILHSSPRRIKSCLYHPRRTTLDIRLFAQVELNAIRSHAQASLVNAAVDGVEEATTTVIRGAILDLDLWLSEWQGLVLGDSVIDPEHDLVNINLRIQHAWAVLALHLRALTVSGIDNIALMTEAQRNIALAAKTAAERHLQLLLTTRLDGPSGNGTISLALPYVASFKYSMEFVWAKNAFCVLIVLRLNILLDPSPDHLMARLCEAKEFLRELDKIGVGASNTYTRILAKTVLKCEEAAMATLQPNSTLNSVESSDGDFQSFIPKEFIFEWDFPGLHLCYIPLEWQDFFLDLGTTS